MIIDIVKMDLHQPSRWIKRLQCSGLIGNRSTSMLFRSGDRYTALRFDQHWTSSQLGDSSNWIRKEKKKGENFAYLCDKYSRQVRKELVAVLVQARTGSQPPCSGRSPPSVACPGARLSQFRPSACLQRSNGINLTTATFQLLRCEILRSPRR